MIAQSKILLILSLISIIIAFSCENEDLLVKVSKDKTRAEAIKNGRHWDVPQALFIIRGDNQDSILIQMSSDDRDEPIKEFQSESTEMISFINIPLKVGKYSLNSFLENEPSTNSSVNYTIFENEIVKYQYKLDRQDNDFFLSIDEISSDKMEIKGNFKVSFVLDDFHAGSAPSDILQKIEFTSGFYICERGI